MKQMNLVDSLDKNSSQGAKQSFKRPLAHGGYDAKGKRKSARPFSPKAPQHIVLKSHRAKGSWSLKHRRNEARVASMVYAYAARFKVHVYRFANVGNHLHLLIKADQRKNLADFLRVLAGRIAVTVSGAQKEVKKIGKFWDHLCWSRLVKWGKEFHFVNRYIFANEMEALAPLVRKLYPASYSDTEIAQHLRTEVLSNPYYIPLLPG